MSLFGLSLAYIRARAQNAALNLLLLALGVGTIVLLLLFSAQLEEVDRWRQHPLVEEVIPIALGDSVAGFRIVGTEHAYALHYGGKPAQGRLWQAPFEATIGSAVAPATGLGVDHPLVGRP